MSSERPTDTHSPRRLLAVAYLLAILHVIFLFTIGEPYPSLQGPMFAGHMQVDRVVHVPFARPTEGAPERPPDTRILRHESLALPVQTRPEIIVPELEHWTARQFLIGHSLRTPFPRGGSGSTRPSPVNWSTYRFDVPWNAPPKMVGEEDLIAD